jgi:hypothetical protein
LSPALALDTKPVTQFGRFAAHACNVVPERPLLGRLSREGFRF